MENKQTGQLKTRLELQKAHTFTPKPKWLRIKLTHSPHLNKMKSLLKQNNLHTVCQEASCPNLGECFSQNKASFLIMGDICTRRCPFCDVAHGRPGPLDPAEPLNLAKTIKHIDLNYVVITSVNRDDLKEGGASHFVACIQAIKEQSPKTKIEILTPDFRGRMDEALETFKKKRNQFTSYIQS